MDTKTLVKELACILDNPDHTEFLFGLDKVKTKNKSLRISFRSGQQFLITVKALKTIKKRGV